MKGPIYVIANLDVETAGRLEAHGTFSFCLQPPTLAGCG